MGERSGQYKGPVFQSQSLTDAHSEVNMEIIVVAVLLVTVGQSFTKPVPGDETQSWLLAEVRQTFSKMANTFVLLVSGMQKLSEQVKISFRNYYL